MKLALIGTLLFFTCLTSAEVKAIAPPVKRTPARTIALSRDQELLHVNISFGDRSTDFHLKIDQQGSYLLQMLSYPNIQREVAIPAKDAEYILSKFAGLPTDVDSSKSCPRQTLIAERISISAEKNKRVGGCVGLDNPESKALLSLANLLSTLF